jgi:hypothetical protein
VPKLRTQRPLTAARTSQRAIGHRPTSLPPADTHACSEAVRKDKGLKAMEAPALMPALQSMSGEFQFDLSHSAKDKDVVA